MRALLLHCDFPLFLLDLKKKKKKNSISKKTLMDFCGSLKNIFSLWNSKLGIWDFETWNLRLWNFASWNFEIWDFENLQLEIFETRDLRILNLKFWTWNLECGILNSRLKIWDLGFENLEFESESFILNLLQEFFLFSFLKLISFSFHDFFLEEEKKKKKNVFFGSWLSHSATCWV